jgi:adenosine deaminase
MIKPCTQPLIDLHRHLDGNVRIATIIDLAKQHAVKLPSIEPLELAEQVFVKDKTSDLLSFLKKLDIGVSVLANAQACERLAYENVEDAKNEGLSYTELRFSPAYMAQAFNLPLPEVVEAVVSGVSKANKAFNYQAQLIGILSRTFGPKACAVELDALLRYSDDIVAVDLAGDEKGFPCHLFTSHFDRVKKAGLHVTIHAGEADGPHSIWDAILLLGADRIGHGVAAYQDRRLMEYMAKHAIGIESCILSNYQTGTWTDITSHPVSTFLEYGIEACLNTDDPGISNNKLHDEYELAKSIVGLSDEQLSQLKRNAIKQAFVSPEFKRELLL